MVRTINRVEHSNIILRIRIVKSLLKEKSEDIPEQQQKVIQG
jgi:hypothetical protein